MGVMLDMNYLVWDAVAASKRVGWPYAAPNAYQRIAADAGEYRAAGFTAIGFPPSCECGGGTLSAGYDKKDDYSLSNTAYGDEADLLESVDAVRDNGMQAYADLVLHQYGGYPNGNYTTEKFPKHPSCFVKSATIPGGVDGDPVPDETGNFAFGDEASYFNSTPPGYMYFGALDAADWLVRKVGFAGARIDDTKGTYSGVVIGIIDRLRAEVQHDAFFFAEYYDGNPSAISNYVNDIMQRRTSVLDFQFKFNVQNICNNPGGVWMGQLSDIGWCTKDAATAVTFIDSADTDSSPGEQTILNKILGYAIMLTFPGYARVYYKDWSTDENCYGLKEPINNLAWINTHLAQGDFVPRLDTHPQVFAHERMGYGSAPGCVALFNNDPRSAHAVTVQTRHPANTRLHEYSGNAGYHSDTWTDAQGRITVSVPKNVNGRSYLVYAPWVA